MYGILTKVIGARIAYSLDYASSHKSLKPIVAALWSQKAFSLSLLRYSHETLHHTAQEALKNKMTQASTACVTSPSVPDMFATCG